MKEARITPHDIAVERGILASMMCDQVALDTAMELLNEESFYATAHRIIYGVIRKAGIAGHVPDLMMIRAALSDTGKLESIGGESYLAELYENMATTRNVGRLCEALENKRRLREVIAAAADMQDAAFEDGAQAEEVIGASEARIYGISAKREEAKLYHPRDLVPRILEKIEANQKDQAPVGGIKTGYERLDTTTTGLYGGELVILAGRPGMGKTSLALNIALNICLSNPNAVIPFFSLEMPREHLVQKMISMVAQVEMSRIRAHRLNHDEHNAVCMNVGKVFESNIIIDDSATLTPAQMRSRMRRTAKKYGPLTMVIVDYLQLMSGGQHFQSRQLEVASISKTGKQIAKEFNIPTLMLAGLSRKCEERGKDKRPIISDLREAGDIEQDADIVLLLYRDEVYNANSQDKGICEVIIGKQRNGPIGTRKLSYVNKYTKFDNLSDAQGF